MLLSMKEFCTEKRMLVIVETDNSSKCKQRSRIIAAQAVETAFFTFGSVVEVHRTFLAFETEEGGLIRSSYRFH